MSAKIRESKDLTKGLHYQKTKRLFALTTIAAVPLLFLSQTAVLRGQPKPLPTEALEKYDDPPAPFPLWGTGVSPGMVSPFGAFTSHQVNVNASGQNITGDAANEPSIAVDPTNGSKMVIGWRQFNSVSSNFRQGGFGFTSDGGTTWTFPGILENNVFRSDPVLGCDDTGRFLYLSLMQSFFDDMWRSLDGGQSFTKLGPATGGDKPWFTVDNTPSTGHGFQYQAWSTAGNNFGGRQFSRSTDGGFTWMDPIFIPNSPQWGTLDVDSTGNLFIGGVNINSGQVWCVRSTNAKNGAVTPTFDQSTAVNLGGTFNFSAEINPAGLAGQLFLAVDRSGTSTNNNIYMMASVQPTGANNGNDVMFVRSTNGGQTFSAPQRINDDPVNPNKWHWFGTFAVAPNGRLDSVWLDTRNAANNTDSQLFYSYSTDGGITWAPNIAVSIPFNPFLGYPNQDKLGDYITIVSDNTGGDVAYAATFNLEEDIYYIRVSPTAPTPTPGPTATPTPTPIPTPTPAPTATATPTAAATPTPSPSPTATPMCLPVITQSSAQTIVPDHSVSCNNGEGHTDNSYWRAFNMATFTDGAQYNVTSVSFGVESTKLTQSVRVRLYTTTNFPTGFPGSLTQIATAMVSVTSAQSGTVVTTPLLATVPAGTSQLVMELFTPDGRTAGNLFFVGSNAAAETGPSYISAPACGIATPTMTTGIGFPEMHVVFNVFGTCSGEATPTPTPGPATLRNIATRLQVGTGDRVMTAGFIVQGSASKRLLIRAAGPSLANFGVLGALANPQMELHDSKNTMAVNDDWETTQIGGVITSDQVAEIQNSGLAPSDPLESAIIATLAPGSYTAIVQGVSGGTGVGIVEVYDLDAASASLLANISTRGFVQTEDDVMIGGFIVVTQPTKVIIRAIAPSLTQFGVPDALADPQLELHDATSMIGRNDDWQTTQLWGIITSNQVAEIQNGPLAPTDPAESAIIATLQPGSYTVIVRGVNSPPGTALVEIYALQED